MLAEGIENPATPQARPVNAFATDSTTPSCARGHPAEAVCFSAVYRIG